MIAVHVSKCPERLRGDLTKWLYPVGTGFYVGRVNARIREYLWERILEYVGDGSAVMAWDSNTETGIEIRLHNAGFELRDYDGLSVPFMRKIPEAGHGDAAPEDGFTGRVPWRVRGRVRKGHKKGGIRKLAFVDIETTGLDVVKDSITEVGVLSVDGDSVSSEWSSLVSIDGTIPAGVAALTGISDDMLRADGVDLKIVLDAFVGLIAGREVMCYNERFDIPFLDRDMLSFGLGTVGGMCEVHDVLKDVKSYFRTRDGPDRYRLQDVAGWFGIDVTGMHRALKDCRVLYHVWLKVNENRNG